jgi:hypothetical protein
MGASLRPSALTGWRPSCTNLLNFNVEIGSFRKVTSD